MIELNWGTFLSDLPKILEIYEKHENSFDYYSIHGRMHICRALIFGEFMIRYYYSNSIKQPAANDVRYAIAFHDSGREGNGVDIWENASALKCNEYLSSNKIFNQQKSEKIGNLILKDGPVGWNLEKRIVHDADVLEIMRPCCGHGGIHGFRENALRFYGRRDDIECRDEVLRKQLINEAWELISVTEELEKKNRDSSSYLSSILDIVGNSRDKFPLLSIVVE